MVSYDKVGRRCTKIRAFYNFTPLFEE